MTISPATHRFAIFPLNFPPPGEGWLFVQAVTVTLGGGGGTVVDPYRAGGSYLSGISVTSNVFGVFARLRTDGDRVTERQAFLRYAIDEGLGDFDPDYWASLGYPRWLTDGK